MTVRRSLLIPLLLLLVAVGASCSGDDESAGSTTTVKVKADAGTESADTTAAPVETAPETTEAPDPAKFASSLAAMRSALTSAGNDFCKIALAANSAPDLGPASSPDDLRALYSFYNDLFTKVSVNIPASDTSAADADVIRNASAQMMADGEAVGWDPAQIPSQKQPAAFDEPQINEVMNRLSKTISDTCAPGAG